MYRYESNTGEELADGAKRPVKATHFGIELEFVFAFKEELLQSILNKYNLDSEITKELTDYEHRSLLSYQGHGDNPAYSCRDRHPSWAMHVPQTDTVHLQGQDKGMFANKITHEKYWVRRYVMEPLLVAKDCFDKFGLTPNVIGWIEPNPQSPNDPESSKIAFPSHDKNIMIRQSMVDYTRWTLTNDHTLTGALRSQLCDHLAARDLDKTDSPNWDSSGMELISPVLDLNKQEEAFETLGKYLNSLVRSDTSSLESVWASNHVHIGFDIEDPKEMPILTLQHLAYILVTHEDLISKCHPRNRCGIPLPPKNEIEPDTERDDENWDAEAPYESELELTQDEKEQENDERVRSFETQYTGFGNVDSNAGYLRERLASHAQTDLPKVMRDAIFKKEGDIFDLVSLLQRQEGGKFHRGYMYNFANLCNFAMNETTWKPIKPTVEFRQHACTLDVEAMKHWVRLLEAIVRMAEEKALNPVVDSSKSSNEPNHFAHQEGSKYIVDGSTTESWPCQSMRAFCVGFLGLDEVEGDYWEQRFERYNDDRPENLG